MKDNWCLTSLARNKTAHLQKQCPWVWSPSSHQVNRQCPPIWRIQCHSLRFLAKLNIGQGKLVILTSSYNERIYPNTRYHTEVWASFRLEAYCVALYLLDVLHGLKIGRVNPGIRLHAGNTCPLLPYFHSCKLEFAFLLADWESLKSADKHSLEVTKYSVSLKSEGVETGVLSSWCFLVGGPWLVLAWFSQCLFWCVKVIVT